MTVTWQYEIYCQSKTWGAYLAQPLYCLRGPVGNNSFPCQQCLWEERDIKQSYCWRETETGGHVKFCACTPESTRAAPRVLSPRPQSFPLEYLGRFPISLKVVSLLLPEDERLLKIIFYLFLWVFCCCFETQSLCISLANLEITVQASLKLGVILLPLLLKFQDYRHVPQVQCSLLVCKVQPLLMVCMETFEVLRTPFFVLTSQSSATWGLRKNVCSLCTQS